MTEQAICRWCQSPLILFIDPLTGDEWAGCSDPDCGYMERPYAG